MIIKRTFLLTMLLTFCGLTQHCKSQVYKAPSDLFKVSRDTIQIDIEGRLSKALLVNDKYYAFYEVRDPMSTCFIKKFYIIAKDGKIEREIKVPEGIHLETYYKLSYWHGQFIVNTELYKKTFYLDRNKFKFMQNPEFINIPLYEDENYEITADCHGEFGSTIYFKDKSTGIIDPINENCPFLINKLGDKYVANTGGYIEEIENPMKVDATAKNNSKSIIFTTKTKTIFKNDNFDSHFRIPTSFLVNGVLYHIYNSFKNEFTLDQKERVITSKDTVKIGTVVDGQFTSIYTLKDQIDIALQQQLSPDYQICTFHTEGRTMVGFKKDIPPYEEAKYGFIEIKGNEIKIHYFFSNKS